MCQKIARTEAQHAEVMEQLRREFAGSLSCSHQVVEVILLDTDVGIADDYLDTLRGGALITEAVTDDRSVS